MINFSCFLISSPNTSLTNHPTSPNMTGQHDVRQKKISFDSKQKSSQKHQKKNRKHFQPWFRPFQGWITLEICSDLFLEYFYLKQNSWTEPKPFFVGQKKKNASLGIGWGFAAFWLRWGDWEKSSQLPDSCNQFEKFPKINFSKLSTLIIVKLIPLFFHLQLFFFFCGKKQLFHSKLFFWEKKKSQANLDFCVFFGGHRMSPPRKGLGHCHFSPPELSDRMTGNAVRTGGFLFNQKHNTFGPGRQENYGRILRFI